MTGIGPEFVALQQALVGRYSLERELGRGGMGIVFLARDVALDRPVAIKLLQPDLARRPALRARFLGEARTAAKLSQPNVVPIHAVEETGELVFFVMAYVEGETLGERLRTRGPLTPTDAARMIQEIAWALGYAHGRGVVHRDVKPDNIMLERGSNRALIMDFGIAAAARSKGGDEILGTAAYISPEQASAAPVDGRADLYSLGVVAFLALTGRLPFDAPDAAGLIAMHLTRPAPTVGSVAPGMPRKLAQAVDRCLAKRPDDRYPDGEALAEAIGGSIEPRRELPVPIRVWLTKGDALKPLYGVWYVPIGLMSSFALFNGMSSVFGVTVSAILATKFYLLAPLGVHSIYRLWRLRRLLGDGFRLDDIRLGVREAAEKRREELTFEFGHEPPLPAKAIRAITLTAYAGIAGIMLAAVGGIEAFDALPWAVIIALSGTLIGRFYPGRRVTRDFAYEMRLKFWNSRFGKLLEKLARTGLKPKALPAELTYRPTEMAIGLAADALFETLPKEQRKELKELPAVVQRLQHDASLMRKTVEELNGALAGLGEEGDAARSSALASVQGSGADVAGNRGRLRADLTARRDQAAERLATAVAALENLRLNLLRLKAGMGSVDALTADLTAARAVGDTMRFASEGREEVERLLLREPQHG